MDLSYPPFETMDEIGKPTGISVRIAQALADFSAAFEALADIAGSQLRHCGAIGHQESADECLRPGCDAFAMLFEDAQEISCLTANVLV